MGEVKEVLHSEERVGESVAGSQSPISIDQQHGLQEGHKLPAICLFSQLVGPLHAQNKVHLQKKERGLEEKQTLTFGPRVRALTSITY